MNSGAPGPHGRAGTHLCSRPGPEISMNASRQPQRCVDGVLLLDKPVGITSNDALMRARRLLNARKAGHGGTLDPMATGLLPVAFGEATKFLNDSLDADKTYLADIVFGTTTTTGDVEGDVVLTREVRVNEASVRESLAAMVGEVDQVPPMHSALKRDGKPLYEYAREGVVLEREARRVTLHALDLLAFDSGDGDAGSARAVVRVRCSKGTYIRTFAEDLGERLGCGAHLGGLRRERVGNCSLGRAITLEALEAMAPGERDARLQPLDFMLEALPAVELDAEFSRRFLFGQRLRIAPPGAGAAGEARVRVYQRGRLLGTATLCDGLLVPLRLVDTQAIADTRPAAVTTTESSS